MGLGAGTPSVSHQSHPRAVPSPSPRSSFIRPRLGSARLLAAWHGAAWQSLSPAVPPPSARCDRAETPLPRRDGAAAAWPVGSCGSRHGRGTGTRGGGHGWEWERGDGTRGDGNVAVARVGVGVGGDGYAWRGSVGAWHGGCAHCGVLCPNGMLLWVRSSRGAGAVSALGVPTPWDGGGGTVWSPWDVWLLGTQFGVSRCALECCSVGCLWGHPAPWGRSGDTWPLGDTLRGAWEIDCGVMLSWMQWGHAALRGHAGDICVSGEAL